MVVGLASFTAYPYSVILCALGLNHGLQSARALCLFGGDKPPIDFFRFFVRAGDLLLCVYIKSSVRLCLLKSTKELHRFAKV